jgi:hypothetical protein
MSGLQPHEVRFLRFLGGHLAIGVGAAVALVALLLAFDFFELRSMVETQPDAWLGLLLLFVGLAVTFGSVAMGIGVMSQARYDEDPPDSREE